MGCPAGKYLSGTVVRTLLVMTLVKGGEKKGEDKNILIGGRPPIFRARLPHQFAGAGEKMRAGGVRTRAALWVSTYNPNKPQKSDAGD